MAGRGRIHWCCSAFGNDRDGADRPEHSWQETLARRPVTFARMSSRRVIVVGGGAAGFFAAITCAETTPDAEVTVLERGPQFLSKVRISGGGRCNVTHACFDARELTTRFPRGERALVAPFRTFPASDTVAWFESRGVKLKTESDGRMFPVSDASQTIIDCLLRAEGGFELTLSQSGRRPKANAPLSAGGERERRTTDEQRIANPRAGAFPFGKGEGAETGGETLTCERLLLATGGCRTPASGQLAVSLGHTLEPPVPSLFTFHIGTPWLRELAG